MVHSMKWWQLHETRYGTLHEVLTALWNKIWYTPWSDDGSKSIACSCTHFINYWHQKYFYFWLESISIMAQDTVQLICPVIISIVHFQEHTITYINYWLKVWNWLELHHWFLVCTDSQPFLARCSSSMGQIPESLVYRSIATLFSLSVFY